MLWIFFEMLWLVWVLLCLANLLLNCPEVKCYHNHSISVQRMLQKSQFNNKFVNVLFVRSFQCSSLQMPIGFLTGICDFSRDIICWKAVCNTDRLSIAIWISKQLHGMLYTYWVLFQIQLMHIDTKRWEEEMIQPGAHWAIVTATVGNITP